MNFEYVHPLQKDNVSNVVQLLANMITGNVYEILADKNLFLDPDEHDQLNTEAFEKLLDYFNCVADEIWDKANNDKE